MSSQPNRLAKGGMIDRSKTVRFSFDGEQFTGFRAIRSPRRCSPTA